MVDRRPTIHYLLLMMLTGSFLAGVIGCATTGPKSPEQSGSKVISDRAFDPIDHPSGLSRTLAVQAALLPLGRVPYDNMVLPVFSPDGRFIATQTGVAPTWETILAEPGAEVPEATRIEIYRLDWREKIEPKDRQEPALVAAVNEPVLLGRSCDADGFLVESPREDGARWVGKANWNTGAIEWLVSGTEVNAFACMGPDGRLAWSRRPLDRPSFDLVISHHGKEWTPNGLSPAADAITDWLLPTWSGRSDGLFVLELSGDTVSLCYAQATGASTFRQSIQRLQLATGATRYTAFQTLSGQATLMECRRASSAEQVVFFHPALERMAFWRPLAPPGKRAMYLNAKSIAALVPRENFALVATETDLIGQSLIDSDVKIPLVAGVSVPRPITSTDWPYLLLAPDEGHIGLAAMRLMPK